MKKLNPFCSYSGFFYLKYYLFLMALVGGISLHADWVPEDIEIENNEVLQNNLNSRKFLQLKAKIEKELEHTWCSKEKIHLLMDLAVMTQPKVCVEIGAFTGSSILPVAATLKYLNQGKIYAIDAWSIEEAVKGIDDQTNNKWWSSLNMDELYKVFRTNIKRWGVDKYVKVIRKPSYEALEEIKEPIDFINFDGNFSLEGSLQDVKLYLPKVRPGGYVLLSNLFAMVNGKAPKIDSFIAILDSCEMICEIEKDNAILFRKRIED